MWNPCPGRWGPGLGEANPPVTPPSSSVKAPSRMMWRKQSHRHPPTAWLENSERPMNKELLQKMQLRFDALVHKEPGSDELNSGLPANYRNHWPTTAGTTSWQLSNGPSNPVKPGALSEKDHFRGVTKMVFIGSEAARSIGKFMLTRCASYLIAQNGDPQKEAIAFAQISCAVQYATGCPRPPLSGAEISRWK